jgi:hypothetical protein
MQMTVADDRVIPAQAILECLVVTMAGSGLKSAQRKKVTECKQTAMHRQGAYMINAGQELYKNFTNVKQVQHLHLSSHNHCICIL